MSADINRKFSIVFYAMSSIWYCLAMVEVVWYYVYFHIPMFCFFIMAYALASYFAYRRNVYMEYQMNTLCLGITILCFCANVLLFVRGINPSITFRTGIVIVTSFYNLAYRRQHLVWLRKEARMVDRNGISIEGGEVKVGGAR